MEVLRRNSLRSKEEYDEDEIKRFFSLYSKMTYSSFLARYDLWHPPTDIYETEDEFIVICELAGVKKDNIQVLLEGNVLRIKGRRDDNVPPGSVIFHDIEILYGQFEREVILPKDIVITETKAIYKDGLLRIHLKKGGKGIQEEKEVVVE